MLFKKPSRLVKKVFLHCSASDNPAHDDVSVIRQWHLERGFNDVGYHFFITSTGKVQPGRPLDSIPAAQKGHNLGSIAICLHGLKKEKFTSAQFASLRALCKEIADAYGRKSVSFHGHCEVERGKTCPVFDYRAVLNLSTAGWMEP